MAPRNPLTRIKDTALGALKDPRSTAEHLAAQARDTVSVGKAVAEGVAEQVVSRVRERVAARTGAAPPSVESPAAHLRAVPEQTPAKPHGDPVRTPTTAPAPAAEASPADVARRVGAKKATAKKATAKKATAKRTAAKKTAATTTAKKTTAKKTTAKKTTAKKAAPGDKLPPRRTAAPSPAEADGPTPVVEQALAAEAAGTTGAGAAHEPRGASRDDEHGTAGRQRAEVEEIAAEADDVLGGDDRL